MRQNPKVCLQADEIGNSSNWLSVIVTGTDLELSEPQYHTAEREHARELLAQHPEWWRSLCRKHATDCWFLRWRLCSFASTLNRSADFVPSRTDHLRRRIRAVASKQELEKLDIIRLAALCENVARSSAIDKQIAAQAASGRIRSSG